ncbi:antitoxin VbhA family protein [Rhodococcus sp. Q]|uniref:antitoxin VbhA family protein n=1 Tax=Rhodococcus sp. Q TaxID=2502252 RepID=UPI0010F55EC0|nr:antitoxin VbhA family protein [Rhodococcus sp. Q]
MPVPHTAGARSEDEVIAAVAAGHKMAGMPLTADDVAALRRVERGESTTEEEVARARAELFAHRDTSEFG